MLNLRTNFLMLFLFLAKIFILLNFIYVESEINIIQKLEKIMLIDKKKNIVLTRLHRIEN